MTCMSNLKGFPENYLLSIENAYPKRVIFIMMYELDLEKYIKTLHTHPVILPMEVK